MSKRKKSNEAKIAEAISSGADPRQFVPVGLIRHVVGNYHVGAPFAEIRERIDKSAREHSWPDAARRYAIKVGLSAHKENRDLYRTVATGRF